LQILRVVPKANTAYIVFREPEVLTFTKYVNCRAEKRHFHLLANSYFGVMDEEEDEDGSSEEELGDSYSGDDNGGDEEHLSDEQEVEYEEEEEGSGPPRRLIG